MDGGFPLHLAAVIVWCGVLMTIIACASNDDIPTATAIDTSPTFTATSQPTMRPTPRPDPTQVTATNAPIVSPTQVPEVNASPTIAATQLPSATSIPTPMPRPTIAPTPTESPTVTPFPAMPTREPTPTAEPTVSTPTDNFIDSVDCNNLAFPNGLPMITVTLRYDETRVLVNAEHADDAAERGQGLMCRSDVPDGTGMLFEFSSESPQGFWMYNTYVPLDIVYLNHAKLAVDAKSMSPCPRPKGASESEWQTQCTNESGHYRSALPARYALELPSGWLDRVGIPLERIHEVEFSW